MPGGSNSDREKSNKKSTLRSASLTADMDTVDIALQKQAAFFEKLLEKQADSFQRSLQTVLEVTNTRIDKLSMAFGEIKASLEYTQKDVEQLKTNLDESNKDIKKIDKMLVTATSTLSECNKEIDYLENQSRRNNLRIDGIPEENDDSWAKTEELVREMLATKLAIPTQEANEMRIERAHRIGTKREVGTNSRPRTIIVKMERFKDRDMVKRKAKECRIRGLYINEDVSQRVSEKRKELLPKLKQAKADGKIAFFSYDKLIIKDKY